jgi:cytochrome o ubiquinol oxidase subunit 2
MMFRKPYRVLAFLPCIAASGCNLLVLHPVGAIAKQQSHLIVVSTILMLLIVIPVLGLTFWFAWRYRASNTKATYAPEWDHSTALELLIWSAPLLIVIALGAITWINTHTLDPYRPLNSAPAGGAGANEGHLDGGNAVGRDPMIVEVVALDWKWLFIYPQQGIATVNELAAPVDVPIRFKITSSSVMNSFFIPALAGQIYAMPGMQTELNAVINDAGIYEGFSANYSGAGFSGMHFKFHGMPAADFQRWVKQARDNGSPLNAAGYLQLAAPSEREPVRRYSTVPEGLYDAILNQCVKVDGRC